MAPRWDAARWFWELTGTGKSSAFFVDEAARGQGVGRALLEAIEGIARRQGVGLLQLETGTANHEALALYHRFGYRRRGPFGSYEADLVSVFMKKEL